MLSFENDYSEGCCKEILAALEKTNMEQLPGYGSDHYTKSAKEKIKKAIGQPDSEIFFLNGGTMANQLVIDTMAKRYEGVISAETGHVNSHEAGAIEFTGHKVLPLPAHEGKLKASEVEEYVKTFYADDNHEHMVFPGLVYISHPTEYGTLYTKKELFGLSSVCQKYDLPLYLDGARLAYALAAHGTDVTLPDIAALCDVFYIGGTKCGALSGEAVVFSKEKCPPHLLTQIKQHGDLAAKGRLIGIQFDVLFSDDLYFRLGKNAIDMAEKMKKVFIDKGYPFFINSPTNQQFLIIENSVLDRLKEKVLFSFWEKYDDNSSVVRFATSWATRDESIEELREMLDQV